MYGNITKVSLVDKHAAEETIRYIEEHGSKATYDDLVKHLSWYWERVPRADKGWMIDWIKCLTGEISL